MTTTKPQDVILVGSALVATGVIQEGDFSRMLDRWGLEKCKTSRTWIVKSMVKRFGIFNADEVFVAVVNAEPVPAVVAKPQRQVTGYGAQAPIRPAPKKEPPADLPEEIVQWLNGNE